MGKGKSMIITHYLEIYPRDFEYPRVECLCDRNTGFAIINTIINKRPDEKYFITFRKLDDNQEEDLKLPKEGGCYYERDLEYYVKNTKPTLTLK